MFTLLPKGWLFSICFLSNLWYEKISGKCPFIFGTPFKDNQRKTFDPLHNRRGYSSKLLFQENWISNFYRMFIIYHNMYSIVTKWMLLTLSLYELPFQHESFVSIFGCQFLSPNYLDYHYLHNEVISKNLTSYWLTVQRFDFTTC